jgi:hypothetical protein
VAITCPLRCRSGVWRFPGAADFRALLNWRVRTVPMPLPAPRQPILPWALFPFKVPSAMLIRLSMHGIGGCPKASRGELRRGRLLTDTPSRGPGDPTRALTRRSGCSRRTTIPPGVRPHGNKSRLPKGDPSGNHVASNVAQRSKRLFEAKVRDRTKRTWGVTSRGGLGHSSLTFMGCFKTKKAPRSVSPAIGRAHF